MAAADVVAQQLARTIGAFEVAFLIADFSGDLLIRTFGDGEITAFRGDESGDWGQRGQLRGPDHRQIAVDGLWTLEFGHGAPNNGPVNTLFSTAGPNDEQDGLFGSITGE